MFSLYSSRFLLSFSHSFVSSVFHSPCASPFHSFSLFRSLGENETFGNANPPNDGWNTDVENGDSRGDRELDTGEKVNAEMREGERDGDRADDCEKSSAPTSMSSSL